nr:MAG TPA: hypothetical protein [Bacteriophage sp.]
MFLTKLAIYHLNVVRTIFEYNLLEWFFRWFL